MDKQQSIPTPSIRRNPSHKHQSQQPILPTKFENFTKTQNFAQNTFLAQPITKHSTTFILLSLENTKPTHTTNHIQDWTYDEKSITSLQGAKSIIVKILVVVNIHIQNLRTILFYYLKNYFINYTILFYNTSNILVLIYLIYSLKY